MDKLSTFYISVLFLFCQSLGAQHLDVEGPAKIKGLFDLRASLQDSSSLVIGKAAGINTDFSTSSYDIFIGRSAGFSNLSGKHNLFLGYKAGMDNESGQANTFIGNQSALHNLGGHNTFLGFQSGTSNTTGNYNTFIGTQAGNSNTIGDNNIFIGYLSGPLSHGQDISKAIAIGYNSRADCSNCAIIGGSGPDSVSLGIGTASPKAQLHVAGKEVRISRYGHSDKYFQFRTDGEQLDLDLINGSLYINTDNDRIVTMGPGNSNVGIGTNNPGGFKLKVQHDSAIPMAVNRINNDGTLVELQQDGILVGSIDVVGNMVSYNPFTGSHLAHTDHSFEFGRLASLTGKNRVSSKNQHAEVIYGIVESNIPNDPGILGSYLGAKESINSATDDTLHLVMAVGNGSMWVVDNGCNIDVGDYLISSGEQGHAMKDLGVYEVSHVIAKAVESVDWADESEFFNGKKHKLISVTFEQFDKNNLKGEINRLREENSLLRLKLEKIEVMLSNLMTSLNP